MNEIFDSTVFSIDLELSSIFEGLISTAEKNYTKIVKLNFLDRQGDLLNDNQSKSWE